jgi:hypothetical protein
MRVMTPSQKQNMVIRKLLLKRRVKANTVSQSELVSWFAETTEEIEEAIRDLLADPNSPVTKYGRKQEIRLIGVKSAVQFLDANGGEVPSNLEKHLDTTR